MGKIGKAMKALWWIARKPVLLNRVLTDEDSWKTYVGKIRGLSEGLPVISLDQVGKVDSVSLEPMTFLDGGSLPTDMMLLAGLAEEIRDCRYFEIGTWRGESVSTVASRAKSCHTLCLTDEGMRAMGMHEKTIEAHRMFSKELENVIHLRGDSRGFDFASLEMKFDLLFIDGDHHYDFILSDTRNVFKHLVHENSIVVWHDYGFHPDQVRFEVMAAILDGVGADRAGNVYHVAHTKCAIYTGKHYPAKPAAFPVIPDEYYNLELTRKKI
ncbi:MAG: class I SAM-dependent methyltransferase [Bacteroidota bacterium]